ncbi:MAG: HypC/HybG/HupF family hydrogenase formation chaperone [Eubacteriales bacterium]|nr:HypC/HybG/HupF family hydrogenase formation chaperone [Eubacteriales bacterium]
MCLAVPMRIEEIDGKEAIAASMGISRKVRIDFIEAPAVGDYVIVHAGFAIEKLPEEEALEDISMWEEVQSAAEER